MVKRFIKKVKEKIIDTYKEGVSMKSLPIAEKRKEEPKELRGARQWQYNPARQEIQKLDN